MQQKASDDINFYFSFILIVFYNADLLIQCFVSADTQSQVSQHFTRAEKS